MTRPDEREDSFEARWTAAGATPDELGALRSSRAGHGVEPPPAAVSFDAAVRRRAARGAAKGRAPLGVPEWAWAAAGVAGVAALLWVWPRGQGGLVEAPGAPVASVARPEQPREEPEPGPAPGPAPGAVPARRRWVGPGTVEVPGGRAHLAEGSVLELGSPTELILVEGEVSITLAESVDPTPPVLLRAGTYVVEVPGARYAPGGAAGSEARPATTELRVRVEAGEGAVEVSAGEVLLRASDSTLPPERLGPGARAGALFDPPPGLASADRRAREALVRGAAEGEARARRLAEELAEYRRAHALLRGGDPRQAAQRFTTWLARHPKGALREEAELSLIEAHYAAGDDDAFERVASRWLRAHPGHPRSREVRRLLDRRR